MNDNGKDGTLHLIDLAAQRMGGAVLYANDEFFAPKEALLLPGDPIFIPDKYVPTGKWMDGWETRRRRTPGHDFCILRLGARGVIDRLVVDTRFFRGNFPAECQLEGCDLPGEGDPEVLLSERVAWRPILLRAALRGDSLNPFRAQGGSAPVTHLRFSIYPDGGVARLRVLGRALPDWDTADATAELVDLMAAENGGHVLGVSDMFFGHPTAMLMPGRAADMSDGWETRRRRGPGHDWALLGLGARGRILRAEVDTLHFKGNAPGRCDIEICDAGAVAVGTATAADLEHASFVPLLAGGPLRSHENHRFAIDTWPRPYATHVRLRIHPDGGVSRFRLFGRTERSEQVLVGLGRWNGATAADARALLERTCASPRWAEAVTAARPFASLSDLFAAADSLWRAQPGEEWLRAFSAHPRIGERGAGWSQAEQAGVAGAQADVMRELSEKNRAYEEKFGHVFLICASGKSADEMLAELRVRLAGDAASELARAAEEQRKITHLRLFKGLCE